MKKDRIKIIIKETEYKGYYASSDGRIFSTKIKGGCGKINYKILSELSYSIDRYGYKRIAISRKIKNVTVKKIPKCSFFNL